MFDLDAVGFVERQGEQAAAMKERLVTFDELFVALNKTVPEFSAVRRSAS